MLRKTHILAVLMIGIIVVTVLSISAEESLIPLWIKNTASFWVNGDVSDKEFISSIEWMLENKVLQVSTTKDSEWKAEAGKLYKENQRLEGEVTILTKENQRLEERYDELYGFYAALKNQNSDHNDDSTKYYKPASTAQDYCHGCFFGHVTEIIDGDTIKVDGQSIRFALVDTPEYGEYGFDQARNYIKRTCPVGSPVLVDEDDMQTQGSYGRMIALVYCSEMNLNEAVLEAGLAKISTNFCSKSEFSTHAWAQKHGCAKTQQVKVPQTKTQPIQTKENNCDSSYPTVCIPPYPPDLDCGEIQYRNFKVLSADPHRFDGDKDGIGCEE